MFAHTTLSTCKTHSSMFSLGEWSLGGCGCEGGGVVGGLGGLVVAGGFVDSVGCSVVAVVTGAVEA